MNIFEYFAEEERDIERRLDALVRNYEIWSREMVFDRVKEVGDEIMGHLRKQEVFLAEKFAGYSELANILAEAKKDRLKLEDELGRLVEVHVDEPNYDEVLESLLKVFKEHIAFSERFFPTLQKTLSRKDLDSLDAQINNVVLHSSDFNSVQPM